MIAIHPKLERILTDERLCPNCKKPIISSCEQCNIFLLLASALDYESPIIDTIYYEKYFAYIDFTSNDTTIYEDAICMLPSVRVNHVPKKFDMHSISQFIKFLSTFQ